MSNSADVWCSRIVFRCHFPDGCHQDVKADLAYRACDPTVVSVTFPDSDSPCSWVFGRDLICEGLLGGVEEAPVGLGDVKVWTDGDQVWITLDTPSGFIKMSTSEQPFAEFVLDSYDQVSETEQWQVEVDNLLTAVLG